MVRTAVLIQTELWLRWTATSEVDIPSWHQIDFSESEWIPHNLLSLPALSPPMIHQTIYGLVQNNTKESMSSQFRLKMSGCLQGAPSDLFELSMEV